jgi:hypothetical protein
MLQALSKRHFPIHSRIAFPSTHLKILSCSIFVLMLIGQVCIVRARWVLADSHEYREKEQIIAVVDLRFVRSDPVLKPIHYLGQLRFVQDCR